MLPTFSKIKIGLKSCNLTSLNLCNFRFVFKTTPTPSTNPTTHPINELH